MTERVRVPGARGITDEISEAVIDHLIDAGRLPADFDFRLLGIANSDYRAAVAQADVLAALGYGEGSGESYLTDPLPDCVLVTGFESLRPILGALQEEYHSLTDLHHIYSSENIPKHEARLAWALYASRLNPALSSSLEGIYAEKERAALGLSKDYQYKRQLGRIVMRDEALLDLYRANEPMPRHGAVKRRMLHYLLLDNHPDLGM